MKCHKCGATAAIQMRQHRLQLCAPHFVEWVTTTTQRAIETFQMFTPADRVLVAVSGGKDSLSLWDLLLNLGYQAEGLYISLGIDEGIDYSAKSLEMCRKFVAATLEGWRYVLGHREETLETVMKRAEAAQTGTNRSHQRWMLDRMCELILPVDLGVPMGELSRDAYERVARELKSSGQLQTTPAFEEFHAPLHP